MKRQNYMAWEINSRDFPYDGNFRAQASFLIRYAILAPNSHNTQPWKFNISNNFIEVCPDCTRSLSYSDRTHRELYLSLGCCIGNLLIAADYFGFEAKIEYLPESTLANVAANIKLTYKHKYKNKLLPYISKRITSRFAYSQKKMVSKKLIAQLSDIGEEDHIKIHIETNKEKISQIAQIVKSATYWAFKDSSFKEELSQWVRSNYTSRFDGMPLFAFGVPGILSLFAKALIKNMPASIQAVKEEKLISGSTALIVVAAPNDTKEWWLKAGKTYEYLAISAVKEGLKTAPMGAIIEMDKANIELQKLLGISAKPLIFTRMGYLKKDAPPSPRRPVEELIS